MEFLSMKQVRVTDPFFVNIMCIVKERMIPYQWQMMNDLVQSHCIQNFRIAAGDVEGSHSGTVFLDTDVAKWLEAVAYSLILCPDLSLEALADDVIDLIRRAQQPDGYLNTYYTVVEPEKRWTNLMEGHELYTAGHMIEAAVAYHFATGKTMFLTVAQKLANHIEQHFGSSPGYPGHPEIELALFRLAEETGEERYANLAQHFLSVRGQGENYFEIEKRREGHRYIFPEMSTFTPEYSQSHQPVTEQRTATGHAVRAMYLYSAMADHARLTHDQDMRAACEALYQDVVHRQMYITGAIGSAAHGERFTSAYDLPNDTAYAETCASIGLMRFAARMFLLTGVESCMDIWERVLRNTVLAGMSQDGEHFFYVNPQEMNPSAIELDPARRHVKPTRQKWFGVACCPPNIARTILSMGKYLYAQQDGNLYVLSHIASEATWDGGKVSLSCEGNIYTLRLSGQPCACYLRMPVGFIRIDHAGGDCEYTYTIQEEPMLMAAHPLVRAAAGKVAIVEGSTVYCLESIDNGADLGTVYVDTEPSFECVKMEFLPEGMHGLKFKGYRLSIEGWKDVLYAPDHAVYTPCTLTAIPYSQWNNRGLGEMVVWIHKRS